ncbi:hypothetical protein BASA81_003834 [Batrachochytrium salamandrivorans]|nr:hypothetical protein BASA81_003834 [Batrachochytrium salamandrivorans]
MEEDLEDYEEAMLGEKRARIEEEELVASTVVAAVEDFSRPSPCALDAQTDAVPGSTIGPVPIIRFFGVTNQGCSVAVHVHGFTPYFYCDPPSADFNETKLDQFRDSLEARLAQAKRGAQDITLHVLAVQLVTKQSIYGYSPHARHNMLQIFVASPTLVATARGILERGFRAAPELGERSLQTYESNVPFVLRFMVDQNIVGCNWLELRPGTYSQRLGAEQGGVKETRVSARV